MKLRPASVPVAAAPPVRGPSSPTARPARGAGRSARETAALLVSDRLSVRAADRCILDGASLSVASAELVVVMGKSGAGKTTLLKSLNRLIAPSAGRVLLAGIDTAAIAPEELRRRIALVWQTPFMSDGTVGDNLQRAGHYAQTTVDQQRCRRLLEQAAFDGDLTADARRLSVGQQQRVALARALVAEPEVLLCDEPTASLDHETALRLESALRGMSESGMAIVFVTHDAAQSRGATLGRLASAYRRLIVTAAGATGRSASRARTWERLAKDPVVVSVARVAGALSGCLVGIVAERRRRARRGRRRSRRSRDRQRRKSQRRAQMELRGLHQFPSWTPKTRATVVTSRSPSNAVVGQSQPGVTDGRARGRRMPESLSLSPPQARGRWRHARVSVRRSMRACGRTCLARAVGNCAVARGRCVRGYADSWARRGVCADPLDAARAGERRGRLGDASTLRLVRQRSRRFAPQLLRPGHFPLASWAGAAVGRVRGGRSATGSRPEGCTEHDPCFRAQTIRRHAANS